MSRLRLQAKSQLPLNRNLCNKEMVADTTLFSLPIPHLEISASGTQKVPAIVCLPRQLFERKVHGQVMTPVFTGGQVLVARKIMAHVEGLFEAVEIGTLVLKSLTHPIPAFAVAALPQ